MGVSEIRVQFNVDLNAEEQTCDLMFSVNDNDGKYPFHITLTSKIMIKILPEEEK